MIPSEVFPQHLRGRGNSVAITCNWVCDFFVVFTFLALVRDMTLPGTYFLYFGVNLLSVVFVYRCVPETTGLSLEETAAILGENKPKPVGY